MLETLLLVSLVVALACSVTIAVQVYVFKETKYKRKFSTWQAPMIFAILADLYFLEL
jgi:hypothetical protein